MTNQTWRERAACYGDDTEKWFPACDESEYRVETPAMTAAAQPAKASEAASTARVMSAGPPAATTAYTSPVKGLRSSVVRPSA